MLSASDGCSYLNTRAGLPSIAFIVGFVFVNVTNPSLTFFKLYIYQNKMTRYIYAVLDKF